ncbi:MAG: radical SAM protein [Candidatus Bathyarchaeota archaeon]|nr:radical SAM protein [Candidatus Bathyarchaeota archaeon]
MNIKKSLKRSLSTNYGHIPKQFLKRFGTPRNIVIEPIAGCNLRCHACPSDSLEREYGKMTFENFIKVLDKMDPNNIGLYFMGEPFLNNEIFEMIKAAKKRNIKVTINTNGTTLYRDYEKIVESGLDHLNISLDGFSQESMNSYRKGIKASEILQGIKLLSMAKEQHGPPHITIRTLLFKPAIKELAQIVQFVKTCKIDDHRLITPIITGWGGKINTDADKLGNDKHRVKAGKPDVCPSLFRMAVTWDGEVLPCCNDVHGQYSFGNIFESSFEDIFWNNDLRLRKCRREFSICDICMDEEVEADAILYEEMETIKPDEVYIEEIIVNPY